MHLLKVEPKLRAIAEKACQAKRSIRRNGTLAVDNLANARRRDTNLKRQCILGYAKRSKELLLQHFARMRANPLKLPSRDWSFDSHICHSIGGFTSVIIRDFDVVRTVHFPDKTDTVLVVDSDAVLTFAFAFERLKSIPRRYAQINQIDRRFKLVKLS